MKQLLLIVFFLSSLFGAMPKFLMPDEAFIPHASLNTSMQIDADIELGKDMYLYEDKVKFELKNTDGISISEVKRPIAVEHDEFRVYLTSPSFLITLKNSGASGVKDVELVVSYQGCSQQGLCYEPLQKSFNLSVDSSKITSPKDEQLTKNKDVQVEDASDKSETDVIADTIKNSNIFIILLTFLGFGLLLSLTPCVFPMIPIISGVIVSQGKGITTRKAFALSVVYVLAMAVAYTIAGVLAGLFGANLQAALENPWVIYSFSAVFVALAFSMFGFYELKLPDSLVAKVSSNSNRSGYIGVAIMGFLSALIVGPCVAAPLAGALVYIGQTGDALLGGMALFAMSIGMGLPLIAVGVSAGKFMPKPGMWMTMVSAIFGVMMLGVAIWMLERVVDEYITMLLYAILGIGFAIYLGALEKGGHVFKKSVAVILFAYSFMLLVGVLGGSKSMARPLEFLKPQVVTEMIKSRHKEFKVRSLSQLNKLLEKNKGKKIMLDFYADWCTSCKELEEITFKDKNVQEKMSEFVLIKADLTDNTDEEKELSKKYGVFGPPVILFFDKSGEVKKSQSIVGYLEPKEFIKHLNKI